MKRIFAAVLLGLLLTGCANDSAAVLEYEKHFEADWIKGHVVVGQTTREQILLLYGKPINKTSMMSSGLASAIMPDEIWTYSYAVTEMTGNIWGNSQERRSHGLAISFKNGVVSNVSSSSME